MIGLSGAPSLCISPQSIIGLSLSGLVTFVWTFGKDIIPWLGELLHPLLLYVWICYIIDVLISPDEGFCSMHVALTLNFPCLPFLALSVLWYLCHLNKFEDIF